MDTWVVLAAMFALLLACASPPERPDPCAVISAATPGPRQAERSANRADPTFVAALFLDEARATGDAGFTTLAATAAECAVARDPDDIEALRLRAGLWIDDHRFHDAELEARRLRERTHDWREDTLLGDALMEQGRLDAAAEAYQAAVDIAPGYELYDRIAWLRWLWGDVDGAEELLVQAVALVPADQPAAAALILTDLGWLHALQGEPAPELDEALVRVPGHPAASLARARVLLGAGDRVGAAADLAHVPASFEAQRLRRELDPGVDLDAACGLDRRGCAIVRAETDPAAALAMLDEELLGRQDAVTHMAHAYATWKAGGDGAAEARAALATGIVEPRVLLQAGRILGEPRLITRAESMGPGLLPSERSAP